MQAEILYHRSCSLLELQRVDDAVSDARLSAELRSSWPLAHLQHGYALERAGKFVEAQEVHSAAVHISTEHNKMLAGPLRAVSRRTGPADSVAARLAAVELAIPSKRCGECGATGALKCCSRCRAVFYCSAEHQREHLQREHKRECPLFQQAPADRADIANTRDDYVSRPLNLTFKFTPQACSSSLTPGTCSMRSASSCHCGRLRGFDTTVDTCPAT